MLQQLKILDNDEDGYTTTKKLLKDYPDVNALFISSGGISGICKAIKEANKVGKITVIASGRNPVIEAYKRRRSYCYNISKPCRTRKNGCTYSL